jgi:predicted peroxiredoxin
MAVKPQRLVIVVWSAGPERPVLAAAPFVYALAARALEIDVEMHFTSTAVRWLLEGVAGSAHTDAAATKTVLDFIREANAAGIRLYACSMGLAEHRGDLALISECSGVAGAATVIASAVDDSCRALVF